VIPFFTTVTVTCLSGEIESYESYDTLTRTIPSPSWSHMVDQPTGTKNAGPRYHKILSKGDQSSVRRCALNANTLKLKSKQIHSLESGLIYACFLLLVCILSFAHYTNSHDESETHPWELPSTIVTDPYSSFVDSLKFTKGLMYQLCGIMAVSSLR
jgi:hypothetical protein